MALTDTEIKRAKGTEEPYRLPDAGGLFLWVTPPGGKLWRWKYRHIRTRRRDIPTVGTHTLWLRRANFAVRTNA